MKTKLLLIFAAFLSGFFVFAYLAKDKKITIEVEYKASSPLPSVLQSETDISRKIGQFFIIGVKGKEVDADLENMMKELHPGGILLLGENIESETQLRNFIFSLQKIALNDTGIPLLITVDQEGGEISRIKWAESTPQSQIKTEKSAYDIAYKRGADLKKISINLNFSPVLDSASSNDFISARTFKADAGALAKQMINGYKDAKIFSCAKHFPGYSGISFNPEDKLAFKNKIPEILQFKKAGEALPEFVMVSNVVYSDFDKNLPFSFLSSGIDFLKKSIPGDYLVVSDDLSQNSLLDNFSLEDIVSKPFNAGIDMLIFSGWRMEPEKGISAFKKAVEDKKISNERIEESYQKILKLKQGI